MRRAGEAMDEASKRMTIVIKEGAKPDADRPNYPMPRRFDCSNWLSAV